MEDSQWAKNIAPIFAPYFDAKDAVEKTREVAETMLVIPDDDDDDDDAEELCNCTFTLAYGTKVRLRITKFLSKIPPFTPP